MDSTTQALTTLILLLAFASSVIATQLARRRRESFPLRAIPAYDALPLYIGEAIEAGRPMHVSFGGVGIGGGTTALTLASAELFYHMAQRNAAGSTILTVSDPSALPIGYGTLRQAYATRRERMNGSVRWFPAGARSLAFAAALTATLGDDKVGSNVLVGSFGSEIALILEAAARRRQSSIAGSIDLEGQAVAYAMADRTLIGEELFVAGAYMGDSAAQRGSLVALDTLRWLLILGIVIAAGNAVREPVADALAQLLGGG